MQESRAMLVRTNCGFRVCGLKGAEALLFDPFYQAIGFARMCFRMNSLKGAGHRVYLNERDS